jgi:hypothetical protein
MYRAAGSEAFRPVGEVEFANGAAAMSATGGYGTAAICAGIVGHVNLLGGESARAVLEAEISAGQGRFRGIRHSSAWDADVNVAGMYANRPKGLLLDSNFRKGFACLAPLGLSFDSWLFHPQIGEFIDLARAFSGYQNRARSLRRSDRTRPLCRPARGDLSDMEGIDPGSRGLPQCSRETRRPGDVRARL